MALVLRPFGLASVRYNVMGWLGLINSVIALMSTLTQIFRDRSLREEGRRGAFLDLYKENYERLRKAGEIRGKTKPTNDPDIADRL